MATISILAKRASINGRPGGSDNAAEVVVTAFPCLNERIGGRTIIVSKELLRVMPGRKKCSKLEVTE